MRIFKRYIIDTFYKYTILIYRQLGHSLSAKQKAAFKHQCEKYVKEMTFRKYLKEKMKERKEKKAAKKCLQK